MPGQFLISEPQREDAGRIALKRTLSDLFRDDAHPQYSSKNSATRICKIEPVECLEVGNALQKGSHMERNYSSRQGKAACWKNVYENRMGISRPPI